MAKKKYKKSVGHFFYNGSSLGSQYSLFPQGTNNWKLNTSGAPTKQGTQNLIDGSKGSGDGSSSGGNFMSRASAISGMASMFDSLAQNLTVGFDSQRAGVNNQPQVLVEGVLGGQSGSHLSNMWNTGAKTAEAINYVNQQGNVDFAGSSNEDLLAQHSGVGTMNRLNIDTKAKELEDFAFDPASYVLTRWVFKNREKASDRQKRINEAIDAVNVRQQSAYNDAVRNFENRVDRQIAMNYRAFGGPLDDFAAFGGGALGYDVAKDNIIAKQLANQDKMKNSYSYVPTFANGGLLSDNFTNGVTMIDAGGTHEGNPNMGVPMGMAPDGEPNLVEEGESIYKDYVFSNRLRVPEAIRKKYKLRGPKDMTYSEAFKKAQEESEERENDPISKNGLDNIAMILAQSQEQTRAEKNSHKKAKGGHLFSGLGNPYGYQEIEPEVIEEDPQTQAAMDAFWRGVLGEDRWDKSRARKQYLRENDPYYTPKRKRRNSLYDSDNINALRLAEVGANAGAVFTDTLGITNKFVPTRYIPDYRATAFTPLGDYAPEAHYDINYDANQQAQQAAATKAAIMNTTNPSRFATLLAADYNAQIANGDLRRKAATEAYDNLLKTLTYNRATKQYNSEMAPKIALENEAQRLAYANAKLNEFNSNEERSNASWGARGKNVGNLAASLANIGREQDALNWRDMLIRSGVFGTLSEKPSDWSDKKWQAYQDALGMSAYGGKLKKKKRGLTY